MTYYPPPSFHFGVAFIGATAGALLSNLDASFQEVSGIQADMEVDTIIEGGENRFAYRLPRSVKYPNLVMKRGVVTMASTLASWVEDTLGSGLATPVEPRDLLVSLLNKDSIPLISWNIVAAYPVKWQLAPLAAMDNSVLVETLELAYNYFNRIPGIGFVGLE